MDNLNLKIQNNNKSWGYEELIENNNNFIIKKIFIKEKYLNTTIFHNIKLKTIVILKGTLRIFLGNDINSLDFKDYNEGEYITIKPLIIHKMMGITDCIFIETSTIELWDETKIQEKRYNI